MGDDDWGIARARSLSFASERLIAQLRALAYDAEALLRATADHTGEAVAVARARTEASLRRAKEDAAVAADALVRGASAASDSTIRYVRANPLQAVGIAVAVGFVLGRLSQRR